MLLINIKYRNGKKDAQKKKEKKKTKKEKGKKQRVEISVTL
jgi:hypothetical protein